MRRLHLPDKPCERCGANIARVVGGKIVMGANKFRLKKYCSKSCGSRRGVSSQSWESQHKISRKMRKGFCERCGRIPAKMSQLHAHHIDRNWKNHSPENVVTLCDSCHGVEHTGPRKSCRVCGGRVSSYGLCDKHYRREKEFGDPLVYRKNVSGMGWQLVKEEVPCE